MIAALIGISDDALTLFRAKTRLSVADRDWPRNINFNYWLTQ